MPATVISLYPKQIHGHKPGLSPTNFYVDASDGKTPAVLVVEDGCFNTRTIPTEENPERRTLIIPESSDVVARSIVEDAIRSTYLVDEDSKPAIFWKTGRFTAPEVELEFSLDLARAKEEQFRWFGRLLRDGDDQWQIYHKHICINDLHRMAAKFLQAEREWNRNPSRTNVMECKFCGTIIADNVAVCSGCKNVVNKEKFEALSA